MKKIFSQKHVPIASWSSSNHLNLRPKPITLFLLCVGLGLFGLGESLLITANIGVTPWTVLAQGISRATNLSTGEATLCMSLVVLLLWIPLRQIPGIGTVLNALIIAAVIEFSPPLLPHPTNSWLQATQTITGILMVGIGSGIYLVCHLGAGPRDGLMTGLQRVTQLPIAWVRTSIEVTVVVIGWFLGGTVGAGTVMFALAIGPAVSVGLVLASKLSSSPPPVDSCQ
jgi:uncharacterized membrane protein YczE